jgi:hypothetical protein
VEHRGDRGPYRRHAAHPGGAVKKAWVEAERAAEVRDAARDWKQADAIDAVTLDAIEAEFPARRVELAKAWKVLIFVLVSVATIGIHAGIFLGARGSGSYFALAAILAAATEVLRDSRFAGTGSDAATSFWAVNFLTIAVWILFEAGRTGGITPTIAVVTIAWALACWRWGFGIYGAFAAIAAFLFLARYPSGRLAWGLAGAALCMISVVWTGRPRWTSSRRRALAGVFVVSALALYGAVNLYSFDHHAVEVLSDGWRSRGPWPVRSDARLAFAIATAVVPIVFLAWGLRARRRLVLDTGAILAALSILTLEYSVRFGSVEITAFGLALIGLALWLNRRLRQAPGEEIRGFTASPLLSADSGTLSPAGALAAAAVLPVSPHRPDDTEFSEGGGQYGGGGATGTF